MAGLNRYFVTVAWERKQEFTGSEVAEVFAYNSEEAEDILRHTELFVGKTVEELGGVVTHARLIDSLVSRFIRWVGGGVKTS